ncbi:MAG: LirA/MavJ family T4SS effector [Variovorax sp.]
MAFPVIPNMTAEQFHDAIIKPYFPQLVTGTINYQLKGANKTETKLEWVRLGEVYASIGAFLTRRAAVRRAWESLEVSIRDNLGVRSDGSDVVQKLTGSHKALTTALQAFETRSSFNNPGVFNFDIRQQVQEDESNKPATVLKTVNGPTAVALPRKAPIVTGQNLDGQDFNKILLAHGYQFKDVGAGAAHGEFSHRLQWYAIGNAANDEVDLQGLSLLEVFRSMGDWKWPKSWVMTGNFHLYIWESLFDNFKTEKQANSQTYPTIAWTANTFCCPEIVNDALISTLGLNGQEANVQSLYCLRTLVANRFAKRNAGTFDLIQYQNKKVGQLANASLGSATSGRSDAALLLWKGV